MQQPLTEMSARIAEASAAVSKEVFNKLLAFAGIDGDKVTTQNAQEVGAELKQRGYEIRQEYIGQDTFYRLYQHDKLVVSARVWSEFSEEDGTYKATIKHQLIPVTKEG